MRDENSSLSHHRIHLNWLTNKNTWLLALWSGARHCQSLQQANLLCSFRHITCYINTVRTALWNQPFPATLGFTCKQLKHTFWEDDLIIPGLRLHNKKELLIHWRSEHTHAHTLTHSLPLARPRPACRQALTTAALVSRRTQEAATEVMKWGG